MGRHRRFGAVALTAVLLAGCSTSSDQIPDDGLTAIEDTVAEPLEAADADPDTDPDPEPEAEPEAEPEPVEIDITIVPEEITEAYVEAVLTELEQLYFSAFAAFREADRPTAQVTDLLASAFTDPQYEARLEEFVAIAESGYSGFQPPEDASPRQHRVQAVHDVSAECIYVETLMDVSGILMSTAGPQVTLVELGPRDVERFVDYNPTRWLVHGLPIGELSALREVIPCTG